VYIYFESESLLPFSNSARGLREPVLLHSPTATAQKGIGRLSLMSFKGPLKM
jgi:hypothetical protein